MFLTVHLIPLIQLYMVLTVHLIPLNQLLCGSDSVHLIPLKQLLYGSDSAPDSSHPASLWF